MAGLMVSSQAAGGTSYIPQDGAAGHRDCDPTSECTAEQRVSTARVLSSLGPTAACTSRGPTPLIQDAGRLSGSAELAGRDTKQPLVGAAHRRVLSLRRGTLSHTGR